MVILKTTNQIQTLDDHGVIETNSITLFLLPTEHQYVCDKSFGGHKNNHLLCISKYF